MRQRTENDCMMKKILLSLMAALLSIALHAQTVDFSKSPEDFFRSYVHQRDTTFRATAPQKDSFWKCLSFHTNLVNWTFTVSPSSSTSASPS